MKKIITIILLTFSLINYAQKLEKIKGSKNVITSEIVFENLTSLELHKNINLTLVKGEENKLVINADDNLHEIVATDNNDGNLDISLTNKISGKKKFELTLYTNASLTKITLNENSKIENTSTLDVEELNLIFNDKSVGKILATATTITLVINDHAKGEMSLKGNDLLVNLNEAAKLKLNATFDNITVNGNQKSTITLSGKGTNFIAMAKNSAKIKAANLKVETAEIIAEDNTTVYTNPSKELKITAEGKSKINIYGNAKIEIIAFNGTASLLKKE